MSPFRQRYAIDTPGSDAAITVGSGRLADHRYAVGAFGLSMRLTKTVDTGGYRPDCNARRIGTCRGRTGGVSLRRSATSASTMREYGSQPHPQVRSAATKSGAGARTGRFAEFAKKSLQPGKFLAFSTRFRVPEDEPEVVPPQWIADRPRSRIDVNGLVLQQGFPAPAGRERLF